MNRAAMGMASLLWRRHRWGVGAVALCLCLGALIAQAPPWSPPMMVAVVFPLSLGLVYLITVFVFEGKDLAARESGFPSYTWTLPVTTIELVGWPMAFGAVTVAVAWVVLARLVMIPLGIDAPVGWPAALLAAVVTSLQAILWTPLPLPFLRVVIVCCVITLLIALGIGGDKVFGVGDVGLISIYGTVAVGAFIVAARGVARARRGEERRWQWLPASVLESNASNSAVRSKRTFTSPAAAQLWMEWNRNGVMLTLMCASIWTLMLAPLLWQWRYAEGVLAVTPAKVLQQISLFPAIPLLFAMITGTGPRRTLTVRRDLGMSPFMATRPLPVQAFIVGKLHAAALSTLLVWTAALVLMGALMLFPVRIDGQNVMIGSIVAEFVTPRRALVVTLVLLGLIGLTWKLQVEGLFVELFGRPWLPPAYAAVVGVLSTSMCVLGAYLYAHPESLDAAARIGRWTACALCIAKLLLAARVLSTLVKRQLARIRTVQLIALLWAVVVTVVWLAAWSLAPHGTISPQMILVATILTVPLVRVSASTLSLASNRHR